MLRMSQGSTVADEAEQLNVSQSSTSSLRRKPSGRSRDSRAWEFWCDKDARSELEEKADQEASGSAADAIGLIRSSSGRGVLQSLAGKREPPLGEASSAKRFRASRTPLLQRSSSLHNKQSPRMFGDKSATKTPRQFRKAASGLGIQMPMTDSDKENWSPERQIVAGADEEDYPFSMPRPQASKRSPAKSGKDRSEPTRSVDDPEVDEEVARFMGRERKSQSVSEEEELDCVQGLLSLSQGNWR